MEIKIFGKKLFELKKSDQYIGLGINEVKKSEYLPDFYKGVTGNIFSDYVITESINGGAVAVPIKKADKKKVEIKLTPKGVHELKLLHDKTFKLNTDTAYVDGQISDFKDKLALIKSEEYDMRNGAVEIGSIVTRMENRKKYPEFKAFYEEYPYTTSAKIEDLVKTHDHLKVGQVAQFLADMPKEAVDVMKEYTAHTKKLCDKKAVFYIIAEKKDFEKSNKRRDPILLAQSPFGHFWQILGAWDKEMLLVDEL